MRYRRLSPHGDRMFGRSAQDFYIDQPEAVVQAVQTRLALYTGEWFLDVTDGTDWFGLVLGANTQRTYDTEIKSRILDTPGVSALPEYDSQIDPLTRGLAVQAYVDTVYGQATLAAAVPVASPTITIYQQPVELTAPDGTLLVGRDGALLFDPRRPVS